MKVEITLRIVVERPPQGVDFGLQKGRGSSYETVQKQRSKEGELVFTFRVEAQTESQTAVPSLHGPFVQGPPHQRFVYLGIGTYAGQHDSSWSRRMKIPLSGITTAMIKSQGVLEARVPGTGKDGGPSCATVKPFGGWKLSRQHRGIDKRDGTTDDPDGE